MKTRSVIVKFFAVAAAVIAAGFVPAAALAADVTAAPAWAIQGDGGGIDFKNAISLDLPQAPEAAVEDAAAFEFPGAPGFSKGRRGTGALSPEVLFEGTGSDFAVEPQEFGTSNHPFTTSRVDMYGVQFSRYYPYRAAGKLYFKIGTSSYVCSASLIKRGVIVTAAHCVFEFGRNNSTGWHTNFVFVPAQYRTGTTNIAPYGTWYGNGTGAGAWVMTSYYNGTDVCSTRGIVCRNDVAVIRLKKSAAGALPGTATGWFTYGYNGYGFSGNNIALFTQLGYPVSHDGGYLMQRTDSQAFFNSANAGNSIWGSRQTGGSSGGPELVNFGASSSLSGTAYGYEAAFNAVVGVTSWGYTSTTVKQQGASPFLSTNIVPLVSAACTSAYLSWCQ